MTQFDWDPVKAESNLRKHEVSFSEASTVLADPLAWTFPDTEHSVVEERYLTIGMSEENKILVVSHTDRDAHLRIISARKATRQERNFYEKRKNE